MANKRSMSGIVTLILVVIVLAVFFPIIKNAASSILGPLGLNPFEGEKQASQLSPQDYSAEIEFEENDFAVYNIYYRFDREKWLWKCPDYGSDYINYLPLDHPAVEQKMTQQFKELTKALIGKNEEDGANIIQARLNLDSDAYLVIYYTNGCKFTTFSGKDMGTSPSLYTLAKDPNLPISASPGLKELGRYTGEKCPALG